jgi:transcriptional regulator with XRE-family HTH domain
MIKIRELRIKAGLSQAELAGKMSVTAMTISNWERQRTSPSDSEEDRLKSILGDTDEGTEFLGASPYATWLTKARLEAKLSVPELAQKSGVTPPAIYRIEQGVTKNVRIKTLKQLEDALGTKLPKDVVEEAQADAKIEGLGQMEGFEPHLDDERPTEPGIYVLYDISNRPIYVGQGDNIRSRIRIHEEKFWYRRPIVESALWIKIPDPTLRRQIEKLLIKFLKDNAVINVQDVERD